MLILPAVDANLKDWVQLLSWIVAVPTLLVTVFRFRTDLTLGRKQRALDLRWKQADAGKKLNDEMLEDDEADAAMQMLDYEGREFELPSGVSEPITHSDVRDVLNPKTPIESERQIYIRDCFDSLFYYMATIDHYAERELVHRDDVAFPLDYYIPRLLKFQPELNAYLHEFNLTRAQAFLAHVKVGPQPVGSPPTEAIHTVSPGEIPREIKR